MHNPYKKKLITEMIVNVVLSLLLLINTLPVSYGAVLAADETNNGEQQTVENVEGESTPEQVTGEGQNQQGNVDTNGTTPNSGTTEGEGQTLLNQLGNENENQVDEEEVVPTVPDVTKYKIFTSYGEGGTINVSPAVATEGETVYFEIVPDSGYIWLEKSVYIGEGSTYEDVPIAELGDNKYSFNMPNADVTIGATFKDASLRNIGVLALADRGTVTLSKIEAHEGDTVTFTIAPKEGYKTSKVNVYSEDLIPISFEETDGTYSFAMIDEDVTVEVTFTPINNPHAFVFTTSGNALIATCLDEDCDLHNNPATLEIYVNDDVYDPDGFDTDNINASGVEAFYDKTDLSYDDITVVSYKVVEQGGQGAVYNNKLPTNAGNYIFVVDFVIDDQTYSISDNFSITKASPKTVAPVVLAKSFYAIQVKNVEGQEYAIEPFGTAEENVNWNNAVTSEGDSVWFDGLEATTRYAIFTRVKGTDNVNQGTVKKLSKVVTGVSSIGGGNFSQLVGNTLSVETEPASSPRKWYTVDENGNKTLVSEGSNLLLTADYVGKGIFVEALRYGEVVGDYDFNENFGKVSYGTVHFETYGGTEIDDVTGLKYGDKVTAPTEDPTKEGADFGGWYADDDFKDADKYDFNSGVTDTETTIYALWNVDSKTVWYHYVDGLEEKMETVTYFSDTDAELLELADTESHKFLGWKTSETTDEIAFPVNSAYNYNKLQDGMDLFAAWQEKDKANYTISIYTENLNGKSYKLQSKEVFEDYIGKTIELDYNYGIEYDGYSVNYSYSTRSGKIKADGSLELSFYLDMNHYKVAFNGNGATGGSMEDQDFASQEFKKLSPNGYTRDGYTFVGWNEKADGSGEYIYSDEETVGFLGSDEGEVVTLYAQWKVDDNTEYTVKHWVQKMGNHKTEDFDYDEDFKEYKTETQKGTTGSSIDADSFKKNLVNFNYLGSDATAETVISGDGTTVVNLYYTRKHYTVTFDANGGTGTAIDPITVWSGEGATLPEIGFERTGYTLYNRWITHADGVGDKYAPGESIDGLKGDLVLYAYWISNDYYIEFDANGGEGYMEYQWFEYDEAENLRKNTFKRTGYEFDYWTIEGDTTDRHFDDEAEILNLTDEDEVTITFVANWRPITYTITYDLDGGTPLFDNPTEYTVETETFYLGAPGKEGYTFAGWTGSNGEVPQDVVYIAKGSTGNREFKANYTNNVYTLSFDANGGQVSPIYKYVSYDLAYGELPTPTKEGYTFAGWKLGDTTITSESIVDILEDSEAVAEWTEDDYTITYHGLEGTNFAETNPNPTHYSVTTKSFLLENPEKVGYTFAGWTGSNGDTPEKQVIQDKGSTGNKEYTANFTANEYVVTFDANGGTCGTTAKSVTYDQPFGDLPWPTRTGYTFKGWYTAAEGGDRVQGTDTVKITEATTLYVHWEINTFGITYSGLDGATFDKPNPDKYTVEDTFTLNNPSKTGYTFLGWTGSNGDVPQTEVTISNATGDKNYTAHFEANKYVVTFDAKGGQINPDEEQLEVIYDSNYGKFPMPTRAGYTFNGWYTATEGGSRVQTGDKVQITDNSTFYAQWTIKTYNISYELNGGTLETENPATYTVEDEITFNNPTKTGYTFTGWKDADDKVVTGIKKGTTGDLAFTATFNANTYVVTFNANGGTCDTTAMTVTYDQEYGTLPETTRKGYKFEGWFTAAEGGEQVKATDKVQITEAITLFAHWTIITFNISYLGLDGAELKKSNPTSYTVEDKFDLNNPTKTGYTFAGWTNAEGKTVKGIKKGTTGDQTFTATFKAKKYKVEFKTHGGSVEPKKIDVTYDQPYGTLPEPTRTGYTFDGWYTKDDGGELVVGTDTVKITKDTDLHAHWTIIEYPISYDLDGGVVNPENPTTYNIETKKFTLNNPTKFGYEFTGWTGSNGDEPQTKVTIKNGSYGEKQYKANYYAIPYIAAYDVDDDVTTDGGLGFIYTIEDYDNGDIQLATATKTGYTFTGWKVVDFNGGATLVENTKVLSSEDKLLADVYLYPNFTPNHFFIKYDANGGEGTMERQEFVFDEPQTLTKNTFTRRGYTFKGWSWEDGGVTSNFIDEQPNMMNLTAVNNGEVVFKARWEVIEYKIEYTGLLDTDTIDYNPEWYYVNSEAITLKNPSRVGYTFKGWTGTDVTVPTTSLTIPTNSIGDRTYTANFEANKYNIVFNANGADGSMETLVATYDVAVNLPEVGFTRDGYDFMGWSTNKDGSGSTYADKAEVKNLVTEANGTKTLYANWKEFKYDDITSATTNNWTIGSNGSIDFTFKRSSSDDEKVVVDGQEVSKTYAAFLAAGPDVKVDNVPLSENDYIAKSGSLILTLKDSYLNRLNPGTHTLTVSFKDGNKVSQVDTTFIVRPKPATPRHNVPMTGVGTDALSVYRTMSLVTALGVLIIIKEKDRFKKDRYKDFN